jgi:hypothetical protein
MVVTRQVSIHLVASLDVMSCPAILGPRLRQSSNFRLQSNTQSLEHFAMKLRSNMLLARHIHTATLDIATQSIIRVSSVACVCMRRQGLNCQLPIDGHSATNILKATWPSPTPIKIQIQELVLHFTGKNNCTWHPNRFHYSHKVGRQWRLPAHLPIHQTSRPLSGMSILSRESRCMLEIMRTPRPMSHCPIVLAQIPVLWTKMLSAYTP